MNEKYHHYKNQVLERVDQLIVTELYSYLELMLEIGRDEGGYPMEPDWDTVEALRIVLCHYLPIPELNKFEPYIDQRIAEVKKEYEARCESYNNRT